MEHIELIEWLTFVQSAIHVLSANLLEKYRKDSDERKTKPGERPMNEYKKKLINKIVL